MRKPEPYRPAFHFTPARGWMNDPNGLIHFQGEYHLFFQHNPSAPTWADPSWGHAVSPDLVHWEELGVALAAAGDEAIFSGSAVADGGTLVAIYTSARPGRQTQCLAFSDDRGRTWTRDAGGPVLDIGSADFRDPKVFRHAGGWVMAVALAAERRIAFYGSGDLRVWEPLSTFAAPVPDPGPWECPDLFALGDRWVLVVSVWPGSAWYWVGDFDGARFVADGDARRLDHGPDYYAAVSFNDAPGGARVMLGWMGHWEGPQAPTSPWRGAMSVPRTVSLRGDELVQAPVGALEVLRGDPVAGGPALDVRATLLPGSGVRVLGTWLRREPDALVLGDAAAAVESDASPVRVLADHSLLEVFAEGGARVLSAQVYPAPGDHALEVSGDAEVSASAMAAA